MLSSAMPLAHFCNMCWMIACRREARAFDRDSKHVRATQADLLQRIVKQNQDTLFGRKHGFAAIGDTRDFQNAVPVTSYEDYCDYIERIADGEQRVLTDDRVRLLEPTGGSTSGQKLIPYTATLQRNFQRALRVWIWNLYSQRPGVRRGTAYWSISPLAGTERRTKAGIPIGFDDDSSYLSPFERSLVQYTMLVPPEVARSPTVEAAQYATLFFLLRSRSLSLISVWSPTFLIELLKLLWDRREVLCDDVAAGRISTAGRSSLTERRYRPLVARAEELRRIFQCAKQDMPCFEAIWPSLALVSCWSDGPSSVPSNRLRQYLPTIEFQPKGLLATEAFVTVPLLSQAAPALAIRSHFFEFQPIDLAGGRDDQHPLLATELVAGRRYAVIVTNGGGLYRYRLNDVVEVVGFNGEIPLLTFVGKIDDISDLVGEKLHAAQVEAVLQAAFRELNLAPTFAQLSAGQSLPAHYLLRIADTTISDNPAIQERLGSLVEHGLRSNPGYAYARALRQLDPIAIELLNQRQADAFISKQLVDRVASGQRLGEVKSRTLSEREA
jgi:GH3 auxin-responsive promoter